MSKPKGGRAKKAPYKTVVVRIPVDLVAIVEQMADNYRTQKLSGSGAADLYEQAIERVLSDDLITRKKKTTVQ